MTLRELISVLQAFDLSEEDTNGNQVGDLEVRVLHGDAGISDVAYVEEDRDHGPHVILINVSSR